MGKKIKKAIKKVTKSVTKVVGGATGGLLGGGKEKAADVQAPVVQKPPAPAAAVVEAPVDQTDQTDEGDTEAAKKAARARGKRGLSVARSAGTGINI